MSGNETNVLCGLGYIFYNRHLSHKHKETDARYKESVRSISTGPGGAQTSMTSFTSSEQGVSYSESSARQKLITYALVSNLIVGCGLPLSIVDHPQFRSFFVRSEVYSTLQADCIIFFVATVASDLSRQSSISPRLCFWSVFNSCNLDWPSDACVSKRYCSCLQHWHWKACVMFALLALQAFKGSHTGVKIAEALETIVNDCCIQRKIHSIVTDNASNMRKALCVFIEACDELPGHQLRCHQQNCLLHQDLVCTTA